MDKETQGCLRLISAVLLAALSEHQSNLKHFPGEAMNMAPAKWLVSTSLRPFGCAWICQYLNLAHSRLKEVMNKPGLITEAKLQVVLWNREPDTYF